MSRALRYSIVSIYVSIAFAALSGCVSADNPPNHQPPGPPPGFVRVDPGGDYSYSAPVWSPDSSKIAYTRHERMGVDDKPSTGEIFITDVNNRETVQLTHNNVEEFSPSWSPNGQQIVYTRQDAAYNQQTQERVITDSLRIVALDGSIDRELYICPASCGTPSWSPNGNRIAFYSSDWSTIGSADLPPSQINLINADGTELVGLTLNTSGPIGPKWSPDGRQIAFKDTKHNQIRITDVQSKVETTFNINDLKASALPLTWSPDQTGILFSAIDPDQGRRRLYFLHFADQAITPFFNTGSQFPLDAIEPDWSPDGRKLVFIVYNNQIYIADLSELKLR